MDNTETTQDTFVKIDETTAKITTVVTTTQETHINIDTLKFDRESLVKTMNNNIVDTQNRNEEIQGMIDDIDVKLQKLSDLGLKTLAEFRPALPEDIKK